MLHVRHKNACASVQKMQVDLAAIFPYYLEQIMLAGLWHFLRRARHGLQRYAMHRIFFAHACPHNLCMGVRLSKIVCPPGLLIIYHT